MCWIMCRCVSVMSEQSIKSLLPVVLVLCFLGTGIEPIAARQSDHDTVDLVSSARKSVVSIEAKMPLAQRMGAFGELLDKKIRATNAQRSKWYISMGSGVIWDNKGHIVTTRSIVENASNLTIKCADGKSYDATLIGVDELTNLAVLRLATSDVPHELVPAKKRDQKLPEGSWLVLMGYGYGGIPTVSPGMAGIPPEDYDSGRHWFQFTAPLRPGNSGGALIDSKGELAGIVLGREEDIGFNAVVKMLTSRAKKSQTPQSEYSNFGVAVPLTQAQPVIHQIIREGTVTRGWIGVSVRQLTDLSTQESELIVVRVIPESPADHAGLQIGDRIRCLNAHDIHSPVQLGRAIRELHPGQKIPVDFDRNGQRLRSEILIIERPHSQDLPEHAETESSRELRQDLKVLEQVSATQ